MIHPVQYQSEAGTAQLFVAGAAPKTISGTAKPTNTIRKGTLIALVLASATTNTTTISGVWQVSDDNSTWYNVVPQNNAAKVVQVTGTGSAVASTIVYEAPNGIQSFKFVRFSLVTGTSTADGTTDGGTISYRWLKD